MGTVYRARDLRSAQFVAVKTCLTSQATSSSAGVGSPNARAQTRFELESRALSEISDGSIVGYVDHGRSERGEPFLVMEWVEGETLAARLAGTGLGVDETFLLGRDLARALGVIHERSIVHRDLKPANVMLRDGDVRRVVLVDFGVARRAANVSVTLSGDRVGTLLYMAPEQVRDPRRVDGRADVFALGCILFECLTGVRAFEAEDALATIAQILLDEAPDPRKVRPELPDAVSALLRRILARGREARPSAGAALARELEGLAERCRDLHLGPPAPVRRQVSGRPLHPAAAATIDAGPEGVRPELEPLRRAESLGPPSNARRRPIAARTNRFVGREAELLHLDALVRSGADLVVLWGPAGVGKTRLAQELAQRGGAGKLGLMEVVDLSQARDLDNALRVIIGRIAASMRGNESAEQVVGRALGRLGEGVFVVDHVEHLARELTPMLGLWRRAAPGVCFLLTSREKLRVDGGVAVELGPLGVASGERLSPESEALSPAGLLFVERAREAEPRFQPGTSELRSVEAVARALDGIPLAIELAAARVPLLGLEGVAARMSKQLELLADASATAGPSEANMRAAIAASVELLTLAERRAFAQCSVFAGGFTVAAAEAILELGLDAPPILDVLQSLRDKSLLSSLVEARPGDDARLCLFSVVREYASFELARSGEEAAARTRHGVFFSQRAIQHGRGARKQVAEVTARVERDSDDLIAAVEYALSESHPNLPFGLEALVALEPVINARGPLPAFMQLIDRGILSAETTSAAGDGSLDRLRLIRGRIAATSGRFEAAFSDLGRVLEHARARSDLALEASAELERGVVHHLRRSLEAAHTCYERALSLRKSSTDPELEGRVIGNLGALLHDSGHLTEAAAYYWRAVGLLEEIGELRMRGNFLNNLGVLEQELRAFSRARKRFEQALTLLVEAADDRLSAITLGNLGVLEQECAAWERARRCHEQALALFAPLADAYSEALCLGRLGATLATLGATAEAETYLNRAQRLVHSAEPSRLEAVRLQRAFLDLALARKAFEESDVETGRARIAQALERCAHVERLTDTEQPLAARSDDIRITLRILKPMLNELLGRA
jgi:predicted ATPase/Tfp pilus assembly protein PilF